ncbi:MAG: GWxTD domain-containing protein [Candidatus Polarisedimenticolia bacterium]
MRLRRAVQAACIVLLLFLPEAHAARKLDYLDKPIPEWREGPVRYVMTKWEDDEYRKLEDQESRARFIESFWRRRDETPETPGNEFRAQFWKRVRDTNRLYAEETAKEGWRTDMGKMHILRGPPDEITRDMVGAGHRGTVIWTYRNTGETGVGPNAVVAFARDVTGEFRMTTEPTKDSDVKQGSPFLYQPPMGTTAMAQQQTLLAQRRAEEMFNLTDPLIRLAGGPAISTPLGLASELVKLQAPPKEWEVRETVLTQEFFGNVPMRARADFLRTTGTATLVVISTAVKSSAIHYRRNGDRLEPDVAFYGRIMDVTGNDLVLALDGEGSFAGAEENTHAGLDDDLVFQARALLPPGSYKARMTVLDRTGGRTGTYEFPLTVPAFPSGELALSSLMPASAIKALPPDGGGTDQAPHPFVLGTLRVLPRLGQVFKPGDQLSFYYQVYEAARDPGTGKPKLDVDYGFFTSTNGQERDLGHVTFAGQEVEVHGYALSLQDWPVGPYLLRVSVTDTVAQVTTTRQMVFEVRP